MLLRIDDIISGISKKKRNTAPSQHGGIDNPDAVEGFGDARDG